VLNAPPVVLVDRHVLVPEDVFERADEAAAADGEPLILDPHRSLVVEVSEEKLRNTAASNKVGQLRREPRWLAHLVIPTARSALLFAWTEQRIRSVRATRQTLPSCMGCSTRTPLHINSPTTTLESAKGRALFVDEAPELYKPDNERDFGHIAMDVIMKFAEDHRHDTMIAMAGYAAPMNRLLGANPGLRSRFPFQLEFSSCNGEDLVAIAQLFAKRGHVTIEPAALERFAVVAKWLCATPNTRPDEPDLELLVDVAGNGRFVRTVIEQATRKAKARMASDPTVDLLTADLSAISMVTLADMEAALKDVLAALELSSP
jgi:hypothetical protein